MDLGGGIPTLPHFRFMGDDVHLHLPGDGNHFLAHGWILPPYASFIILCFHLREGLLAKEDRDVLAEHQRQITLSGEVGV